MKKQLPAILFFLAICQLSAQVSFNRAYHDVNEHSNPFLVNINGDIYFTSQSYDVFSFGHCYLYKHSSSGELKFKSTVIGDNTPTHAYKSLDNKLIVVGQISMCDYVLPNMPNFITKLDTSGNVVFTSTYSAVFQDVPRVAFQHPDSSYYSFTGSSMIKHSKTGQFLSSTNLGLTGISSALLLQNNTILVSAHQSSVTSLFVISSSGTIISSISFSQPLRKLAYYGGQKVMGLGVDGKLYKLSPGLSVFASSAFANGSTVIDFVCDKDTVYAILSSSLALSNYAVLDSTFNAISLSSTTTNSLSQSAICINGSKVAILSNGFSAHESSLSWNLFKHYFVSLSLINKFSSHNFTNDLALISVVSDSSHVNCTFDIFSPGNVHCSSFLRPKIKVKNMGNGIINNFKLNCFDSPGVACGAFFYQEKFTGLALQPGDSLTLTANGFARKGYGYSGSSTSFSNEYCFYTTLPNGETDKVVEDNEQCKTFTFLVTSLNEYSKNEQKINIAPNPFEDEINIQADSEIKQIDVFNTLGMLVKSVEGSGNTISLYNSELPNGIYFLKIETEKGTVTKKVLKN